MDFLFTEINCKICFICKKDIIPNPWYSIQFTENKFIYFCSASCMLSYAHGEFTNLQPVSEHSLE